MGRFRYAHYNLSWIIGDNYFAEKAEEAYLDARLKGNNPCLDSRAEDSPVGLKVSFDRYRLAQRLKVFRRTSAPHVMPTLSFRQV